MQPSTDPKTEKIVILAPTGQDASLIARVLSDEGIDSLVVGNIEAASLEVSGHRAAVLLIAEEALARQGVSQLNKVLEAQQAWSDIPVILMTASGDATLATMRITKAFSPAANLNLIERPFRRITLRSVVQVALRARRKQHEVRELLEKQVVATRSRDEFISIASHELKTPLTSLKLQTQINQRNLDRGDAQAFEPDKTRKLVESTSKQVDRLVRLVEDMLDISRIHLGKLEIRAEEFDLTKLVRETVERILPQAESAGCPIAVDGSEPINGEWDRFRIEQIVTNLLSNAIRYCPGLPIEVHVSAGGDSSAKVVVRDHGPGIAPENCERIFQRFERGANSGSVSGMGIGLYISREIAEAHNGSVTVQSELGVGSAFTLELPLHVGPVLARG